MNSPNFYLNSGFKDQRPSPRCLEKSQIWFRRERNTDVSACGNLFENSFKISDVNACPSTLHLVAIKSRISLTSCPCLSLWISIASTSLSPCRDRLSEVEAVVAFLERILVSSTLEEVCKEPFCGDLFDLVPAFSPSKCFWMFNNGRRYSTL